MFNGPPKSGKTTLANQLKTNLEKQRDGALKVEIAHHTAPLWGMMYGLIQTSFPEFIDINYDSMKEQIFAGPSGRDILVQLGSMFRYNLGVSGYLSELIWRDATRTDGHKPPDILI